MANNNTYKGITVKFGADTTDLGKALKDIDTQAKSINGDLKEIDKGLKLDPKNAELTTQKFQKLAEGVQLTQKRLEMLKAAQASAQADLANGVEGAEQRYKDLQREIAKTETSLANFHKQAKEASEAVRKDLSDAVDKFAGQVKTAAVTVTALLTALGGVAITAAKTADDFNTLSKKTGISTEELQKFSYASSLIDVDVSTLQGSLSRLVRNMQGAKDGTGNAAEAFKTLGVNIKDGSGALRNNVDVFYDVIDALGQVENATERDALAMNIFGRSAQELNPLIIAGSQALKDYGEEADKMGIIFDQKTLDNLNEMNDKLDISKQQLKGASMIIGGELMNSFDGLFGGADKLLKLVQKAKGDGTLAEIADSVASAVEHLMEIIGSAAKFIYKFREEIALGVQVLIAYKAAMSFSNIILGVVNTIKAFTAAQGAATAAQDAFNTAAAANPYGLIAAAAVLAATAVGKFVAAQYEANAAYGEFFDKIEKDLAKNNEAIRSFDELNDKIDQNRESRQKAAADIEGEYYGYEKLIERLYELNEVQGKTEDQRAEMSEIVAELEGKVSGLTIAYNKETGELKTQRDELEQTIQKTKEYALAKAALANQESIASDLAGAQLDLNKLNREHEKIQKERQDKARELAQKWNIDESLSVGEILHELLQEQAKRRIENDDLNGIDSDVQALNSLNDSLAVVDSRIFSAQKVFDELNEEYEVGAELVDKYSEEIEAETNALEEAEGAAEDGAQAVEDLSKAYEDAKAKVTSYRSELVSLISTLDKVNSGTKYSTTQILDLLSQYPELVSSVHLTSEGYEVEAEAIQKLIDKKADLMLTEAREAEETAKKATFKASEEYNNALRSGLANGEDLGELGRQVRETREAWRQAESTVKALEKVTADIKNDNLVQGAAESASKTKEDKTDYWKQAAEDEVAQVEHLYKMGEISAEEYYNRLTDINRRYYENRAQYLEEYRKLEETVYSGLKKQQEEQLSNTKTLLDRINAVMEAKRSLENAENQKVNIYSSAAGFHIEDDKAAIDKAAQSLQSKTLELASLLQQKYGVNVNMPDISGINLSAILPDLSGIRIPSEGASSTKQVTVNYTAGDVIINGNADGATVDRLRALMNSESRKIFEEYLTDYLDRADMDRQTGG